MEQMDLINLPPPEPTEKKKEAPQLAVSGAELADWLCVSPAAITQGRNAGFFVVREDGRYDDIITNGRNTISKSPEALAFFDNAIRTLDSVDLDMVLMQTEDVEENEITGGDTE